MCIQRKYRLINEKTEFRKEFGMFLSFVDTVSMRTLSELSDVLSST